MGFRKTKLTISEAKEMDMVDCLSIMSFEPARVRGNDHWYLSPLRNERTPSFKVNRRLNRWYDHGIGKGGNLVDFAVLFWDCPVADALQKLAGDFSLQQHPVSYETSAVTSEAKIRITGEFPLTSTALLQYVQQRRIPVEIALQYCIELRYEMGGKNWVGIGFKNDLGGYEIRSALHKLSSSPKGITTIKNGCATVVVFEGFFDLLSFVSLKGTAYDFIVLNSLAFLQAAKGVLANYNNGSVYLDNDTAGEEAVTLILSWHNNFEDKSKLYEGYNDLNEWLANSGRFINKLAQKP